MFFGEICDSIRGRIDCRQKSKPKSDRLLDQRLVWSLLRSLINHNQLSEQISPLLVL